MGKSKSLSLDVFLVTFLMGVLLLGKDTSSDGLNFTSDLDNL